MHGTTPGTTPPTGVVTVTGASGFIGSRVVRHARRALPGHRLRLMVHRRPLAPEPPGHPRAETVSGDLADPASLRGLCTGSDVLVHCASQIDGTDEQCRAVNDLGTAALVAEARRAGVRRIVLLSTTAVHGRGPFRDARSEDLPIAPRSAASRTRAAAERTVLDAGGVVLRPHLVYGTGDRWVGPALIRLMRTLDADVEGWPAQLSLVGVDDLARALVAAAVAPESRLTSRVYHANHPEPVPVSRLMAVFADLAGLPRPAATLTRAEAAERLGHLGGCARHLDMITVDHHFAGRALWTDLALDPGPGFPDGLRAHAQWYGRVPENA